MAANELQNNRNPLVSIVELERAINYWRQQNPSSRDTMTLCPQAASLAELYALMIVFQTTEIAWTEFSNFAKESFQQANMLPNNNQHNTLHYKAA